MANNIEKGGIYTFTTIHPSYLGNLFEKARCSGEVEYTIAKLIDANIDATQEAVKPYLPPTASTKHIAYKYFIFITQTNEKKVFAAEWINQSSIKQDVTDFLDIRIVGARESDLPAIRQNLGLAGWNMVNIVGNT